MPKTARSATASPSQAEFEVVGETGTKCYTAADKANLKAKVDAATAELEDLKRQIDLKKEILSDAVFDFSQAMGGKPFRDAHGTVWLFAKRGKENPTYYMRRQGAQDIEEL